MTNRKCGVCGTETGEEINNHEVSYQGENVIACPDCWYYFNESKAIEEELNGTFTPEAWEAQ